MPKVQIKENQVYFGSIPAYNEERNTQPIKEALMREAVKQCDCYCSDLLIFFDYTWKELIKGEISEITLYFRQMGVEWKCKEYENHRSKAIFKITRINSMKDGEFSRVLHKVKTNDIVFWDGEQVTHLNINSAKDIEFIENGFKVRNVTVELIKIYEFRIIGGA